MNLSERDARGPEDHDAEQRSLTTSKSAPRATTATARTGAASGKPSGSRERWRPAGSLPRPDEVPSPRVDWSMQWKCRGASPRPKDFSWENSLSGQAERVPRGSSRSVDLRAWRGQRLVADRREWGHRKSPSSRPRPPRRGGRAERPSLHDKPRIVEARSLHCAWSLPRGIRGALRSRRRRCQCSNWNMFQSEQVQPWKALMSSSCPRSTSGGLSHETQSMLGLCSMVVPAVVPCGAQRAPVAQPVETKAAALRLCPIRGARRHPAAVRISDCSLSLIVSPA